MKYISIHWTKWKTASISFRLYFEFHSNQLKLPINYDTLQHQQHVALFIKSNKYWNAYRIRLFVCSVLFGFFRFFFVYSFLIPHICLCVPFSFHEWEVGGMLIARHSNRVRLLNMRMYYIFGVYVFRASKCMYAMCLCFWMRIEVINANSSQHSEPFVIIIHSVAHLVIDTHAFLRFDINECGEIEGFYWVPKNTCLYYLSN